MKAPGGNLPRDIYRDLRDRRLLSIAVALLLAMIAVPLLVKGDDPESESASATVVAGVPIEGSAAIDPVVLTETPELRDFRTRLDQYRSRNPFEQQLTGSPPGASGGGDGSGGGGSTDDSAAVAPALDLESATSVPDEGVVVDPADDLATTPPVEEETPDEDPEATEPESQLLTTRIDVRVGLVGETRIVKDVKSLALLPHKSHPVVQYLRGDIEGTEAAFTVSPEVEETSGPGDCAPERASCQFLLLEVGEEQEFVYAGRAYRLKLLAVTLHEEPFEEESAAGREPSGKRHNAYRDLGLITSG